MSAIRDALTPEKQAGYDAAIDEFGKAWAAARHRRDERYATGGARAVAEAAYVPGGPSVEELAEGYEQLAQQAREKQGDRSSGEISCPGRR
ncbi:MAG: hypothetical protein ACHP9Z_02165 [Streptosporangiales bacterium]